jgi:hypothetical protein
MHQGYRPNGPHYGLAVTGVMVTAAGLLIMLVLGHNYSACQSFLGQLAQAGSQQDQATCHFATGAHWVGLLVLIPGAIVLVIGVLRMISTGQQQPVAPPCHRCGQPLAAHVQGWCPPCARCGEPFLNHVQGRCPVPPATAPGAQGGPAWPG